MTNSAYNPKSYLPADRMEWEPVGFAFLDRRFVLASHEAADGSFTELVLDADYEVAGDGPAGTGVVRVLAAYPADSVIHVTRATDAVQPEDLPVHSPLPATSVERGLDRQSMLYQELDADLTDFKGRALAVGRGMEAPVLGDLTGAADGDMLSFQGGELGIVDWTGRDGQYAVFNTAGHLIGVDGPLPDGVPALADNITADSGDTVQEELDRRQREVTTVAAMKALPIAAAGQSLHVSDVDVGGDFAAALTASLDADLLATDEAEYAFVPSTASPTYHWVRKADDWPRLKHFAGSDLDIADPWHTDLILQRALNWSSAARAPIVIDRPYYQRYFAYVPDNAMLVGISRDAMLVNDLPPPAAFVAAADEPTAAASTFSAGEKAGFVANRPGGAPSLGYNDPNMAHCCLFLGDMHPFTMPLATGGGLGTAHATGVKVWDWADFEPIEAGQDFAKPVSALTLADYAAGDLLILREEAWHSIHVPSSGITIEHPEFHATFDVVEVTADRLILAQQVPVALASPWGANAAAPLSNDPVTGMPWHVTRNAVIDGLSMVARREKGIPIFRTGFHNCRIDTPLLTGLEGLSCNFGNWSTWSADLVQGHNKLLELAQGGHGMRVRVGHGEYRYEAKLSGGYPIKCGEQVHDYDVTIERLDATGGRPDRSVVYTHESTGKLRIQGGEVRGEWSMAVVHVVQPVNLANDPDQTQPTVKQDIDWQADIADGTDLLLYYYMQPNALAADGLSTVRECRVTGRFGPAIPTVQACYVAGYRLTLDAEMAGGAALWVTAGIHRPVEAKVTLMGGVTTTNYIRDHDGAGRKRMVFMRLNGVVFAPSPDLIAVNGGGGTAVVNPDTNLLYARYTVTNATAIQVNQPAGPHQRGQIFEFEVVNATAGAIPFTFSGWWQPPMVVANIGAGNTVTIPARVVSAAAGTALALSGPITGPV